MPHELYTVEGENLPSVPWDVYPRPQLRRENWQNLNGSWDFTVGEREDLPHRDSLPGIPFTEARHSGRFLVMTLSIALLGFCSNGFYNSFAPYMNDVGYSVEEASRVISIMMGALAIGKASLGWIYDKLGVSAATGLSGVFMCACIAAALFMPGKLPLVIIIAGFSIGFASAFSSAFGALFFALG